MYLLHPVRGAIEAPMAQHQMIRIQVLKERNNILIASYYEFELISNIIVASSHMNYQETWITT